jgi:dTDP-4-amino-4,6-dideoxygalactose transaminase
VDDWTTQRRAVAARYAERFGDQVEQLEETRETPCTYHLFPVRVSDRDELSAHLGSMGIGNGVHYPVAVPDQPALAAVSPGAQVPIARDWAARELSIPIFPGMTDAEVDRVASAVTAWCAERPVTRAFK